MRRSLGDQNCGIHSENTGIGSKLDNLESKYSALLENVKEEDGENEDLHRWLENWADHTDIDFLMTFLRYMQENNPRIERYLPPLTTQTHQQWNSILMAQVAPNHKTDVRHSSLFTASLISYQNKIKPERVVEAAVPAQQLPSVTLFDPTLVQIALRLEPRDYAVPLEHDSAGHFTHFHQEPPEVVKPLQNESKPLPIPNSIRKAIYFLKSKQVSAV
uniref:Uncharacterized protein n=1 Tax=Ditylenchus dipsaci TaxID=166011 RepID=A0A915ERV9_9BILA